MTDEDDVVEYDEIFYIRHFFHADETDYSALHHLVFVKGKTEPIHASLVGAQLEQLARELKS